MDYAATAPLSDSARKAWLDATDVLRANPGNPSSLHAGGRRAARMLEDARASIAESLGAERTEVLFTSGATEANALGVIGAARSRATAGRDTVLVSSVEHDSVGKLSAAAPDLIWETIPVNHDGVSELPARLDPEVVTVSMTLVSAETGVIQPVADLVDIRGDALIHTDAAQAVGHLPVSFHDLGVDLLTVGGHKVGAPVGTGVLLVKRGIELSSDRPGGGQERKMRSGTVDVVGAVALAAALAETTSQIEQHRQHLRSLKSHLIAGLPPEVQLTTTAESSPAIVHLSLPTSHPEILLLAMDQAGVMVSAGSACHAGVTRPSDILLNMGRSQQQALGVLRVSFGNSTTKGDVDAFLAALPGALAAAQRMDQHFKERT